MADSRLQTLFFATAFAVLIGWLLIVGRTTILPIVAGLVCFYILSSTADALGRVPYLGATPLWLRRLLVLLGFAAAVSALALVITINVQNFLVALPRYENNLIAFATSTAHLVGFDALPSWDKIRVLTIAQFGSWTTTLVSLSALTAAQVYVGNFLEPRMIGRSVNLSPFVVLVSLAVWTALWGLPGAILAIPMTSIVVIGLAEIDSTRPIAILLSSDGNI